MKFISAAIIGHWAVSTECKSLRRHVGIWSHIRCTVCGKGIGLHIRSMFYSLYQLEQCNHSATAWIEERQKNACRTSIELLCIA